MIPVSRKNEPPDFDERVRTKGQRFLKNAARPLKWDHHEHWRDVLGDLREAYDSICAYLAHWIPPGTGSATVDHFVPKSVRPDLAYEWDNYRLACGSINAKKREYQDVLDPFVVQHGWFILDLSSLQVRPGAVPDHSLRERIQASINRLDLNGESFVEERWHWLTEFCRNQDLDFLQRHAPFVAYEVRRQAQDSVCEIIGRRLQSTAGGPRPAGDA